MSLKRSRQEMSSKKKMVHFCQDPPTAITPVQEEDADSEVMSKSTVWYTGRELALQLDDSTTPLALAIGDGFSILLKDSFEHPHVNVQEYLNALVAFTTTSNQKEETLRGLEQRMELSHREERGRLRSAHTQKVLMASRQLPTASWDALAQVSRQSSAASKLFAMRMGRADARVRDDSNSNSNDAALEIVAEHQRREEYRRRRSSQGRSPPSSPQSQGPPQSTLAMAFAQAQQQQPPKIKA